MSREEGQEGEKGKEEREEEDEEELDEAALDEIFREMEALGAKKRSRRREEIEAALKAAMSRSDAGTGALILLNLDGGECLSFDSYSEALEHMKKQKGRWYLAPRGIDLGGIRR
ncbi:MAG TPA: hypothetical protein PLX30_09710 [Methanothrix sp.]|nr:hypothetical protein [Methanothrix sp.]